MKTYIMEGIVTALSSISHNGGEQNGITTQLRREKFVQPDGEVEDVPVISGNSIRGLLRDIGMFYMLQKLGYGVNIESGKVEGLTLPAFYFLFSGGALVSNGESALNVDYFRKMKETIPLIGLFGGAIGNSIMPGKIKIGKMIPICDETMHLMPEKVKSETVKSIWDYCQLEMYTRKDDEKNENLRKMIDEDTRKLLGSSGSKMDITKAGPQQMMYYVETLSAGTKLFWKIVLEDVNDIEFEAFLTTILQFSKFPHIGGKSGTGLGEIAIKMDKWIEIDSRAHLEGKEIDFAIGQKYENHLKEKAAEIKNFLAEIK
jgi:CRISPR type IV-associated protein Csf2